MNQSTITIRTNGRGFTDVTAEVAAVVAASSIETGICALFLQHTSASLVVQENADAAVLSDLQRWMDRIAPESDAYEHDDEGPDDMPSHIRSAITHTSEVVPVRGGLLALGTWQAIYLWEHRTAPHSRRLLVTVLG